MSDATPPPLSGEQERAKRIAEKWLTHGALSNDAFPELRLLSRAYLALLSGWSAREAKLRETIIEARRELWWFVERDAGEAWGWDDDDIEEIAPRAMRIQDEVLAAALNTADCPDDPAHAEHLREAREVEQQQEEKHGE